MTKILIFHSINEYNRDNTSDHVPLRINIIQNINRIKYQNKLEIEHLFFGDYISKEPNILRKTCDESLDAQNAGNYSGDGNYIACTHICSTVINDIKSKNPDIIFIHFGQVFKTFLNTFYRIFEKIQTECPHILISFDESYSHIIHINESHKKPFNIKLVEKLKSQEYRKVFSAQSSTKLENIKRDFFALASISKENSDNFRSISKSNFTTKLATAIKDSKIIMTYDGNQNIFSINKDIIFIEKNINQIEFILKGYSEELIRYGTYDILHDYKNLLINICMTYNLLLTDLSNELNPDLIHIMFTCYSEILKIYPIITDKTPIILDKPVDNYELIKKSNKKIVLIFFSEYNNASNDRITILNQNFNLTKYFFIPTYFSNFIIEKETNFENIYEKILLEIDNKRADIVLIHTGKGFERFRDTYINCFKRVKIDRAKLTIGIQTSVFFPNQLILAHDWYTRSLEIDTLLKTVFMRN